MNRYTCQHCGQLFQSSRKSTRGRKPDYCSARCRKAAQRKRNQKRDVQVSQNTESQIAILKQHWIAGGVTPSIERMLVSIYCQHGLDVAQQAGEAVRAAIKEEREWATLRAGAWGSGPEARKLAQLVDRKDERVRQFLKECGV